MQFIFESVHQFLKTFILQACKVLGTVSIVFFNSHTATGRHSHKMICFTTTNSVLIIFYLAVIMFGILIFKCVCNCSSRRILGTPHHQISLFLFFFRKPSEQTIQSLNRMKTFSSVWLQPHTHSQRRQNTSISIYLCIPFKVRRVVKKWFYINFMDYLLIRH